MNPTVSNLAAASRSITRRRALMCGGLLGLGAALERGFPQSASQPNVVFLLADDLGWSDMAPMAATSSKRQTSTVWPAQA